MEGMTNQRCSACGGNVTFDPVSQKLICEHCSTEYSGLQERTKAAYSNELYNNYACTSCGAKLVADKKTIATECAFCGSNIVLNEKTQEYVQPEYILPFTIDKEKAMGLFRDLCKKEKKTPSDIYQTGKIRRMQGVYVPAWLFSEEAEGTIQYECSKEKLDLTSEKRVFDVFNVAMRSLGVFDKIPVNASSYINSRFIESIEPFEYNKLTQFDSKYVMGFFADYSDISADECFKTVDKRVKASMASACKKTVKGYTEVELSDSKATYENSEKISALVPVWFLNITYKKKKYCFTINGQTGKIAGVLPMSELARLIIFVVRSALATLLVTGLSLLSGPIGALLALVGCSAFFIYDYRRKPMGDDNVYYLSGEDTADAYIVQDSLKVSEQTATFVREKRVVVDSE